MSDPVAKAELSKFKDARQQPAPNKPSNGNKKKRPKKPWELQWRIKGKHWKAKNCVAVQLFDNNDWDKCKGYAKKEDAMLNLKKNSCDGASYWFEYRVVNIETGEVI